ncbi:hypothetical protein V7x_37620 [Crateriforma conspicua]|uniref:Uncharacterized protein n=1 Tax=Crateriforma conspicua TaxID=2527996 RepID=A0A5C6FNS5_9PLAN|nr:hypothetical protein V7x_37620 [Crateriforma conspicua]
MAIGHQSRRSRAQLHPERLDIFVSMIAPVLAPGSEEFLSHRKTSITLIGSDRCSVSNAASHRDITRSRIKSAAGIPQHSGVGQTNNIRAFVNSCDQPLPRQIRVKSACCHISRTSECTVSNQIHRSRWVGAFARRYRHMERVQYQFRHRAWSRWCRRQTTGLAPFPCPLPWW